MIRTVMFSRSPHGLIAARNELIEVLRRGLAGEFDPVGATRIWTQTSAADEVVDARTASQPADHPHSSEEPAGFLDLIAEGEAQQDVVNETAEAIAGAMERLGALAVDATAEMEASDARGGGMRGSLVVIGRFAEDLDGVAQELEDSVGRFEDALTAVSSASFAIVERLE